MRNSSSSSGMSFCGTLTLVFIVLKLCKVIDWSWWWVFSPLWIPAAICFGIIGIVALIYIIVGIIDFVCKYR